MLPLNLVAGNTITLNLRIRAAESLQSVGRDSPSFSDSHWWISIIRQTSFKISSAVRWPTWVVRCGTRRSSFPSRGIRKARASIAGYGDGPRAPTANYRLINEVRLPFAVRRHLFPSPRRRRLSNFSMEWNISGLNGLRCEEFLSVVAACVISRNTVFRSTCTVRWLALRAVCKLTMQNIVKRNRSYDIYFRALRVYRHKNDFLSAFAQVAFLRKKNSQFHQDLEHTFYIAYF